MKVSACLVEFRRSYAGELLINGDNHGGKPSRVGTEREPCPEGPTPDKHQRLDAEGILRVDEKVELKEPTTE